MNLFKLCNDRLIIEKLNTNDLAEREMDPQLDLQSIIINSWEQVRSEIGLSSSYLVGRDIKPHESTNKIDLLAFNPKSNSPVIIDFNNGGNNLQMLQLLFYSAILSQWGKSDLVNKVQIDINHQNETLIEIIKSCELSGNVSLVMLSRKFDSTIIRYIESQRNIYSLDVSAFSLTEYKIKDEIFLSIKKEVPRR